MASRTSADRQREEKNDGWPHLEGVAKAKASLYGGSISRAWLTPQLPVQDIAAQPLPQCHIPKTLFRLFFLHFCLASGRSPTCLRGQYLHQCALDTAPVQHSNLPQPHLGLA